MRRAVLVAAGLASLAWFSWVAAPTASAFPLTTCTLEVESRDATGEVISSATGGGPGGTRDDPLLVDPNGTVTWTGTTGGASVAGGSYHVEIFGVPTPLQGSTGDGGSSTSASGSVDLAEILPFDLAGLFFVSGAIDVGGSPVCEGSGWVKVVGDPVGTPGFVGGLALTAVGFASVLASVRGRHPFRGALGGLIGGAGLALLSGASSFLPLDEQTPLAEVVGMLVLGLLIGVIDFGSLFHRGGSVEAVPQAEAPAPRTTPAEPPTGPATEPATAPTPPVVEPPVVPPPVVPPPVVEPPVVPPPVVPAQPDATPAAPAPATEPDPATGTTPPEPPPGLEAIRAGVEGLPDEVKPEVKPLFQEAEGILKTGPGTLTISAEVISKVLAQLKDAPSLTLGNGALEAVGGLVKATPVVTDGKLSLTFSKPLSEMAQSPTDTFKGFIGLATDAVSSTGVGPFDGLNKFIAHINKAVADAGQSIASVSVSPTGIVVTTGPAIP